MKSFLITLLFFCIAVVAYSQTNLPGRSSQAYKSCLSNATYSNCVGTLPLTRQQLRNNAPVTVVSYKNDVPVISVIPTLKLWLLPASFPNPFMKEED